MDYIQTKTMITKNKNPHYWFGHDYNMNIYKGCNHGCIYCDSRSECYRIDNFDKVRAKENAIDILSKDLGRKRKKGVIGTGAMSDPYNPFEEELCLTRESLRLINEYGFGVSILTKSELIERDMDIIEKINKTSPVCIMMTITTFHDELCERIEPNVSVTSKRLQVIKKFAERGIFTGVVLVPILPFINDTRENILGITKAAYDNGAKFVYGSFGVTLRQNQRIYFYNKLDEFFPGIKEKYIRHYGEKYNCNSFNYKILRESFKDTCKELKLLYKMKDIINSYKPEKPVGRQISIFD
ncbi:SPL family radical SAM protein [Anaeromicrobium sediminis]|uniref:Radical SAM protein n=1 Tax=Anaeromicrobium sediminis TaxID=1478221 RepID=A0A267MEM3_9FIRM|nr:radical SAM protein [Anaeromicrobium sediminis]PAB57842.1 radical SAM protein [Anaeromicrobium sediminis]